MRIGLTRHDDVADREVGETRAAIRRGRRTKGTRDSLCKCAIGLVGNIATLSRACTRGLHRGGGVVDARLRAADEVRVHFAAGVLVEDQCAGAIGACRRIRGHGGDLSHRRAFNLERIAALNSPHTNARQYCR